MAQRGFRLPVNGARGKWGGSCWQNAGERRVSSPEAGPPDEVQSCCCVGSLRPKPGRSPGVHGLSRLRVNGAGAGEVPSAVQSSDAAPWRRCQLARSAARGRAGRSLSPGGTRTRSPGRALPLRSECPWAAPPPGGESTGCEQRARAGPPAPASGVSSQLCGQLAGRPRGRGGRAWHRKPARLRSGLLSTGLSQPPLHLHTNTARCYDYDLIRLGKKPGLTEAKQQPHQ